MQPAVYHHSSLADRNNMGWKAAGVVGIQIETVSEIFLERLHSFI